jgi:hypothetical protein
MYLFCRSLKLWWSVLFPREMGGWKHSNCVSAEALSQKKMSPEARRQLIEAGIPPLVRRRSTPLECQPRADAKRVPPRPVIHIDKEYTEVAIKKILDQLPHGKDTYTIPEIARSLKKSDNWVRTRFKNNPYVRDTGNGSKKYLEVPQEVLIEELRKMYVK